MNSTTNTGYTQAPTHLHAVRAPQQHEGDGHHAHQEEQGRKEGEESLGGWGWPGRTRMVKTDFGGGGREEPERVKSLSHWPSVGGGVRRAGGGGNGGSGLGPLWIPDPDYRPL